MCWLGFLGQKGYDLKRVQDDIYNPGVFGSERGEGRAGVLCEDALSKRWGREVTVGEGGETKRECNDITMSSVERAVWVWAAAVGGVGGRMDAVVVRSAGE